MPRGMGGIGDLFLCAARYPWVRFYTPVDEIFVTATFSARLGWWNERLAPAGAGLFPKLVPWAVVVYGGPCAFYDWRWYYEEWNRSCRAYRYALERRVMNRRAVQRAAPALVLLAAGCGISIRSGSTTASRGGVPNAQGGPGKGIAGPAASLTIDTSGNLLASGSAGGGVFRSADGGQTWQPLSIPAALRADRIRRVAATTVAPNSVYAAGPGAGVLRSPDDGQTWRSLSAGLPSQDVAAFAVHSFRPDTL